MDLVCLNWSFSDVWVIVVIGSSGKIMFKEMLVVIFINEGLMLVILGNLNNYIGVLLILFWLFLKYCFVVIELGVSGLGEIVYIVVVMCLEVVVIINVGEVYLEGFGSYDNIV